VLTTASLNRPWCVEEASEIKLELAREKFYATEIDPMTNVSNKPFPSTAERLTEKSKELIGRLGNAFKRLEPDADLQAIQEQIIDPSIVYLDLADGADITMNISLIDKSLPFELVAIRISTAYAAQAHIAMKVSDYELAAMILIDAFYWLGTIEGRGNKSDLKKQAISEFQTYAARRKAEIRLGRFKRMAIAIARERPIGPWTRKDAARYILPILKIEENKVEYFEGDDSETTIYRWLGEKAHGLVFSPYVSPKRRRTEREQKKVADK
jgi:hypothetical protein